MKAVRLHYKNGDDLIKIMPSGGVLDESASGDNAQLTIEEIKAVVATAHDYGFTVAAHAHGAEAIRRAVIGGVDSIEHGTFMDDEDMKLMKEHGTWYVPTIIAGDFVAHKATDPGLLSAAGGGQGGGHRAADSRHRGPRLQGRSQDRVRHRRGGVSARPECARIRADGAGGMPPMFVVQAATTHAAELLKHDKDIGSVTAGKVRRSRRGPGQSARGHRPDEESQLRDEGRGRLQERRQGRRRSAMKRSRGWGWG